MISGTAFVLAYAYGKFLGELNVTFNGLVELLSANRDALIMDASVREDVATV